MHVGRIHSSQSTSKPPGFRTYSRLYQTWMKQQNQFSPHSNIHPGTHLHVVWSILDTSWSLTYRGRAAYCHSTYSSLGSVILSIMVVWQCLFKWSWKYCFRVFLVRKVKKKVMWWTQLKKCQWPFQAGFLKWNDLLFKQHFREVLRMQTKSPLSTAISPPTYVISIMHC